MIHHLLTRMEENNRQAINDWPLQAVYSVDNNKKKKFFFVIHQHVALDMALRKMPAKRNCKDVDIKKNVGPKLFLQRKKYFSSQRISE